jgi:hypothetical protein
MSTAREKLYLCTFTSRTRTVSTRVAAWDDRQAAQVFREELEEAGVTTERGRIAVLDPSRPLLRRPDDLVAAR